MVSPGCLSCDARVSWYRLASAASSNDIVGLTSSNVSFQMLSAPEALLAEPAQVFFGTLAF